MKEELSAVVRSSAKGQDRARVSDEARKKEFSMEETSVKRKRKTKEREGKIDHGREGPEAREVDDMWMKEKEKKSVEIEKARWNMERVQKRRGCLVRTMSVESEDMWESHPDPNPTI